MTKPDPNCGLCHGTGKITYEYCGVVHGGYDCDCPPRCAECGGYAVGGPLDHATGCSRSTAPAPVNEHGYCARCGAQKWLFWIGGYDKKTGKRELGARCSVEPCKHSNFGHSWGEPYSRRGWVFNHEYHKCVVCGVERDRYAYDD